MFYRRLCQIAFLLGLASAAVLGGESTPVPRTDEFHFAYERVLGTSCDLAVNAPTRAEAEVFARALLAEIDRLAAVCDTRDPNSEISRLNAAAPAAGPRPVSAALGSLLATCASWQDRSQGTFNVYLGEMAERWERAEREGRAPAAGETEGLAHRLAAGGFRVWETEGQWFVERLGPGTFVLDAIAKGWILDLAGAAARIQAPGIEGFRLNVGGDILAWGAPAGGGNAPWPVEIVDPRRPADNEPGLVRLGLRNQAAASSGGYARYREIGGRRYSLILDPRTGRPPASGAAGASVVAADAATADALATILCVLPPESGVALVEQVPGAACLIVGERGQPLTSEAWPSLVLAGAAAPGPNGTAPGETAGEAEAWPPGFAVTIDFTLAVPGTGRQRFKRHYLAAWVEDEEGNLVKVLALWADDGEIKYVRTLSDFWRHRERLVGKSQSWNAVRAISQATRRPGTYRLTWDGTDEQGRPVPRGTYTVLVDINREDGPPRGRAEHTCTATAIRCGESAAGAAGEDQPELTGVTLEYGPAAREAGAR